MLYSARLWSMRSNLYATAFSSVLGKIKRMYKDKSIKALIYILISLTWLFTAYGQAAATVVCSVDKLMLYPNETIQIHLLSDQGSSSRENFYWQVEGGSITQQNGGWHWKLSGVAPGFYTAVLKKGAEAQATEICKIKVIVRLPPLDLKGEKRSSARIFLLQNEDETPGYGLYSYLLFGNKPGEMEIKSYLKAIEEILKFPDVTQFENYMRKYQNITLEEARKRINLTYIPLKQAPTAKIIKQWSEEEYDKVSQWILKHYDYERARAIFGRIRRNLYEGPYMVSILHPIKKDNKVSKYLFMDQSTVPPHLIHSWMKEFLFQAGQENYWEDRTMRRLVLKIRLVVGVLAIGLPHIRQGVDELVKWVDIN